MLEIKVEVHEDLFSAGGSHYGGAAIEVARNQFPPLGGVWMEAVVNCMPEDMDLLRAARSATVCDVLKAMGPEGSFSAWMLFSTGTAPEDRIRNYKRLWKGVKDKSLLEGLILSEELTLRDGAHIGFAGLAGGRLEDVPRLLTWADPLERPVVVTWGKALTSAEDVAAFRDARLAPFPGDPWSAGYLALAKVFCPDGGGVIRPGSDFDQRSAWADLIVSPERIPPFAYELANGPLASGDL